MQNETDFHTPIVNSSLIHLNLPENLFHPV